MNTLRHREHDNKTNLDRDNQLLENQFMAELKVRCDRQTDRLQSDALHFGQLLENQFMAELKVRRDRQTDRQTDSRAMLYALCSGITETKINKPCISNLSWPWRDTAM